MYIESHVVVGLCQNPYYDPGGRGWGFVNFACPMGGEFDNQLGQIPILAPSWPRMVGAGHSIDSGRINVHNVDIVFDTMCGQQPDDLTLFSKFL